MSNRSRGKVGNDRGGRQHGRVKVRVGPRPKRKKPVTPAPPMPWGWLLLAFALLIVGMLVLAEHSNGETLSYEEWTETKK